MTEPILTTVHDDPATYRWNHQRGTMWFEAVEQEGVPFHWEARAYFDTREEADAYIARFPKSAGLRRSSLVGVPEGSLWSARAYANLWPNGVTGERNEAGIARYRKLLAAARKLDVPTGWAIVYHNSVPTREAFESSL